MHRSEMCDIFGPAMDGRFKTCFSENALKRQKNMDVFLPAVSGRSMPAATIAIEVP
jgi:hypothetical protein